MQPILLTSAGFYGTLAAARSLGRIGVPIVMADDDWLAPSNWSRFVTRRVRSPRVDDAHAFMDFLLEFGRNNQRHVLCPTRDDLAWMLSAYRDELAPYYDLYQPSREAVENLLDKRRLFGLCQEMGIGVPLTWFPDSPQALEQVAREATFPLLVKPATQILYMSRSKGEQVDRPEDLLRAYQEFDAHSYHPMILEKLPGVTQPMLQQFHHEGESSIYNISGFIDRSGERCVLRAGLKVLQHPRRLGIGLCFEQAPLRQHLVEQLLQLCRHVGYFGVFEVEFLQVNGRELMIDFNPRFYNQLAFDISRGLCLPELMYHAARGAEAEFERCLAVARHEGSEERVYSNRFVFKVMLEAQRLSGALSRQEVQKWRAWYRAHRAHCTDAVLDAADPVPAMMDVAHTVYGYARHPRGFLEGMVFNC